MDGFTKYVCVGGPACGLTLELPSDEAVEVIEFCCKGRHFPGWFHEYRRDGNRFRHRAVREYPTAVDRSDDMVPAVYLESKRSSDKPLRWWKPLTMT